jgi:hypothetical protein
LLVHLPYRLTFRGSSFCPEVHVANPGLETKFIDSTAREEKILCDLEQALVWILPSFCKKEKVSIASAQTGHDLPEPTP